MADEAELSDEGSSASDVDSDAELRRDFAAGKLKPGLNKFVPRAERPSINNVPGLNQKLASVKKSLPWIETLDITCQISDEQTDAAESKEESVHDDFKREIAFYRQAQKSALEALAKLHKMKVPTKRPEDYFAEMLKTDDHMQRVREKLLSKQQSLERSEKARKLREIKKFGKKVQHDIMQKRLQEKKAMVESVKKFRKGKQGRPNFLDADGDDDKFDVSANKSTAWKKGDGRKAQSKKRKGKDQKYGFGGRKRMQKKNSATSSGDMSSFSSVKHSKTPRAMRKPQGKKKTRPGKSRRQKAVKK